MVNEKKRPIIHIPYSILEKLLEVTAALGIIINLIILIKFFSMLPNTIPTHFDAAGTPDNWGSKGALLILPIVAFVLYALLTLLSRFPHIYNYLTEITDENAKAQYHNARTLMICLKTEIIFTFSYIQWLTIAVALGKANGLGPAFIIIFLAAIFGTIGYYIYRSIKLKKK